MMTLKEAIFHEEEVAEEQTKLCKRYDDASGYSRSHNEAIRTTDAKRCEKCAEEHRQIAKWLKKLEEQKSVLDKVRAEIEAIIQEETVIDNSGGEYEYIISKVDPDDVLAIIDKYRTESEMEK